MSNPNKQGCWVNTVLNSESTQRVQETVTLSILQTHRSFKLIPHLPLLLWQWKQSCHPAGSCRQLVWTRLSQIFPWQHQCQPSSGRESHSHHHLSQPRWRPDRKRGYRFGGFHSVHLHITGMFPFNCVHVYACVFMHCSCTCLWQPSTMISFCCGEVLAKTISVWFLSMSSIWSWLRSFRSVPWITQALASLNNTDKIKRSWRLLNNYESSRAVICERMFCLTWGWPGWRGCWGVQRCLPLSRCPRRWCPHP